MFRGKITLQHLFSNTPTPPRTPYSYGSLPLADPISRYRVLNFKFTDHGFFSSFFFAFFFWLTEKSSGHRSVSIMNRLASIMNNSRNGTGARCMRRFKAWTGGFHWLLDFGSFDLEICDGCECFSREISTKLERKNSWMVKRYITVKYWRPELSVFGIESISQIRIVLDPNNVKV